MRNIIIFLLLIITDLSIFGQGIGDFAPEKEPMSFPKNAWGVDIMFGEGGFGAGVFYRKNLTSDLTFFTDLSISEAKDEKEVEYIDYWGIPYVVGKQNRIFLIPLNLGLQYRVFRNQLSDNLRPYVNFGIGPSMVVTTPYEKEFFSSFSQAQGHFTAGVYVGVGANFGLDQSRLFGINLRYYVIRFFNDGVEGLKDRFIKDLGGFYVTINIGAMY